MTVSSTILPNWNPLCTHKVLMAMAETNTIIGILLNQRRFWIENGSEQAKNSLSSPKVCLKSAMKLNIMTIFHPLFTLFYEFFFTTPCLTKAPYCDLKLRRAINSGSFIFTSCRLDFEYFDPHETIQLTDCF